jgi:serine/threonine protein kinase
MLFADQIAAILCILKAKGIFHRDIKPENFLVTEDLKVLLNDFGHATRIKDDNFNVGTPGYMPPELSAHTVGYDLGKADIYSAGVTLYEMLFCCSNRLFQLIMKD